MGSQNFVGAHPAHRLAQLELADLCPHFGALSPHPYRLQER